MELLDIPDELVEMRQTLRDFIDREIRPLEEAHRQEIQETGTFDTVKEERLKLRKRSAELGFWTLHMPEEVGGRGLSFLGQVLLHEEACSHGLLLAQFESIFPVVTGPTPIYMDCTTAQREKYLKTAWGKKSPATLSHGVKKLEGSQLTTDESVQFRNSERGTEKS